MKDTIELILRREGESTRLVSPSVGVFTCALEPGALLGPGQVAGVLTASGKSLKLVTPPAVCGRIANERPERVQQPVGYGTTLYELSPIESAGVGAGAVESGSPENGLILYADQAGRFYRRPSPDEAAYVEEGGKLEVGMAIGLIEIMKTFSQVLYEARGGLPPRAKLVRWFADDGAEVREGDPLLEVE
jgi:acetyl-CoA carboxylase biotin carboxyl carrier protein